MLPTAVNPPPWSGEESTVFSGADTMCRQCRYFRRLQKRYHADLGLPPHTPLPAEEGSPRGEEGGPGVEADDSVEVPVYCVNLLRCNMQVGYCRHLQARGLLKAQKCQHDPTKHASTRIRTEDLLLTKETLYRAKP